MSTQHRLTRTQLERLHGWFARHVDPAIGPTLRARLCAARNNLSYVVSDGKKEWLLRRPKVVWLQRRFGHSVGRQHKVMSVLDAAGVPVPEPVAYCNDPSLLGAPFGVMEKVDGVVMQTSSDLEALSPQDARRCSQRLVDTLADLHESGAEAGLDAHLGPPIDPRDEVEKVTELQSDVEPGTAAMEELAGRLRATASRITPRRPTVLHRDYRIDNVMFDRQRLDRILAVVDWETTALGDPLVDLGSLAATWRFRAAARAVGSPWPRRAAGFLDSSEVVERYAERTGLGLDDVGFYQALGAFRLATFLNTFLAMSSPDAGDEERCEHVAELAEGALDLVTTR